MARSKKARKRPEILYGCLPGDIVEVIHDGRLRRGRVSWQAGGATFVRVTDPETPYLNPVEMSALTPLKRWSAPRWQSVAGGGDSDPLLGG